MSWFKKGAEAVDAHKQHEREAEEERKRDWRGEFRVAKGGKAKFTFLNDDPMYFGIHSIRVRGKTKTFTCLGDDREHGECPYCAAGIRISHVMVWSVLNLSGVKFNDRVEKPVKQRFVAKAKVKEMILRRLEEYKTLKYTVWTASRGNARNECATGEDFTYNTRTTLKALKKFIGEKSKFKELLQPFDLEDIYAPLSREEAIKIAKKYGDTVSDEELDDTDFDSEEEPDIEDLAEDPGKKEKPKSKKKTNKKDESEPEDEDLGDDGEGLDDQDELEDDEELEL